MEEEIVMLALVFLVILPDWTVQMLRGWLRRRCLVSPIYTHVLRGVLMVPVSY